MNLHCVRLLWLGGTALHLLATFLATGRGSAAPPDSAPASQRVARLPQQVPEVREVVASLLRVERDPPRFHVFCEGQTLGVEVDPEAVEIYPAGSVVRGFLRPPMETGRLGRLEDLWPAAPETLEALAEGCARLLKISQDPAIKLAEGELFPWGALLDQRARLVLAERFRGKHVLVNFIFGRCADPQMCPDTTRRMLAVSEALPSHLRGMVEMVFVTLDPDFDTPARCLAYLRAHGMDRAGFSMLTGPRDTVDALYRLCGLRLERPSDGVVQHTLSTIRVGADGLFQRAYPGSGVSVEALVRDLAADLTGVR